MIVQTLEQRTYTVEEYLEAEIQSEERHEYVDGEIIPMTGGTPNHNKIAGNLYATLNFALKRQPYEVLITNQRLWIPDRNIYTYPDIMVMTQPLEYLEGRRDTLMNPLVVVEVLSKSTEAYDRGDKFKTYRTLSSFQEYLLIDQNKVSVEHYTKTEPPKWMFLEYNDLNSTLSFGSIPVQIEWADLYDKVEFESEKTPDFSD